MRNIALLFSFMALVAGCTSNRPGQESGSTARVNCANADAVELRVFHGMYKEWKSAEAVHSAILSNAHTPQFDQLKSIASKESLDESTRKSGGDLGYIRTGQFDIGFERAVFALPLKSLSPPVQSKFGWHLVWVEDRRDAVTGDRCQ